MDADTLVYWILGVVAFGVTFVGGFLLGRARHAGHSTHAPDPARDIADH
jgi:hypothetical protein